MKNNYYYSLIGSFLLFLSSSAAYGQAEVQNPTFPFWKLLGNQNTDTAVNFVGTTDNRALTFRTNNIRRMTVNTDGNVGIGTVVPNVLLQLSGEHGNTQFRLTLPTAQNFGGTGEVNLQSWVSEPCLSWDGAGLGVNVNNTYTGIGCAGGILMPKLNTGLGQAFVRFETNGGNMLFYTLANSTAPTGSLAPRERMSINSLGKVRVNDLAGTGNRDVFADANGTLIVSTNNSIGFYATKTANQTQSDNAGGTGLQKVTWGATSFNDGGGFSTVDSRFTVPAGGGGVYTFSMGVHSNTNTDRRPRMWLSFQVNGGEVMRVAQQQINDAFWGYVGLNGTLSYKLNDGDYVEVWTYWDASNATTLTYVGGEGCYFSGVKIY